MRRTKWHTDEGRKRRCRRGQWLEVVAYEVTGHDRGSARRGSNASQGGGVAHLMMFRATLVVDRQRHGFMPFLASMPVMPSHGYVIVLEVAFLTSAVSQPLHRRRNGFCDGAMHHCKLKIVHIARTRHLLISSFCFNLATGSGFFLMVLVAKCLWR